MGNPETHHTPNRRFPWLLILSITAATAPLLVGNLLPAPLAQRIGPQAMQERRFANLESQITEIRENFNTLEKIIDGLKTSPPVVLPSPSIELLKSQTERVAKRVDELETIILQDARKALSLVLLQNEIEHQKEIEQSARDAISAKVDRLNVEFWCGFVAFIIAFVFLIAQYLMDSQTSKTKSE